MTTAPRLKHPEDADIVFLTGTYQPLPNAAALRAAPAAELDLGCGVGSFTTALARRYPERLILAADLMVGRVRKLAKRCRRERVENVAILRTEARQLVAVALPDAGLDRVHLLCPDPWPKGRHRGHRLLASDFVAQLHRVLKPDGVFHFSSDDEYYSDAVSRLVGSSGLFAPIPPDPALADIRSDFELRWNAVGKTVNHVFFRKLPLPAPAIGH